MQCNALQPQLPYRFCLSAQRWSANVSGVTGDLVSIWCAMNAVLRTVAQVDHRLALVFMLSSMQLCSVTRKIKNR
jgi:type IV secretory pathway TrbD component